MISKSHKVNSNKDEKDILIIEDVHKRYNKLLNKFKKGTFLNQTELYGLYEISFKWGNQLIIQKHQEKVAEMLLSEKTLKARKADTISSYWLLTKLLSLIIIHRQDKCKFTYNEIKNLTMHAISLKNTFSCFDIHEERYFISNLMANYIEQALSRFLSDSNLTEAEQTEINEYHNKLLEAIIDNFKPIKIKTDTACQAKDEKNNPNNTEKAYQIKEAIKIQIAKNNLFLVDFKKCLTKLKTLIKYTEDNKPLFTNSLKSVLAEYPILLIELIKEIILFIDLKNPNLCAQFNKILYKLLLEAKDFDNKELNNYILFAAYLFAHAKKEGYSSDVSDSALYELIAELTGNEKTDKHILDDYTLNLLMKFLYYKDIEDRGITKTVLIDHVSSGFISVNEVTSPPDHLYKVIEKLEKAGKHNITLSEIISSKIISKAQSKTKNTPKQKKAKKKETVLQTTINGNSNLSTNKIATEENNSEQAKSILISELSLSDTHALVNDAVTSPREIIHTETISDKTFKTSVTLVNDCGDLAYSIKADTKDIKEDLTLATNLDSIDNKPLSDTFSIGSTEATKQPIDYNNKSPNELANEISHYQESINAKVYELFKFFNFQNKSNIGDIKILLSNITVHISNLFEVTHNLNINDISNNLINRSINFITLTFKLLIEKVVVCNQKSELTALNNEITDFLLVTSKLNSPLINNYIIYLGGALIYSNNNISLKANSDTVKVLIEILNKLLQEERVNRKLFNKASFERLNIPKFEDTIAEGTITNNDIAKTFVSLKYAICSKMPALTKQSINTKNIPVKIIPTQRSEVNNTKTNTANNVILLKSASMKSNESIVHKPMIGHEISQALSESSTTSDTKTNNYSQVSLNKNNFFNKKNKLTTSEDITSHYEKAKMIVKNHANNYQLFLDAINAWKYIEYPDEQYTQINIIVMYYKQLIGFVKESKTLCNDDKPNLIEQDVFSKKGHIYEFLFYNKQPELKGNKMLFDMANRLTKCMNYQNVINKLQDFLNILPNTSDLNELRERYQEMITKDQYELDNSGIRLAHRR